MNVKRAIATTTKITHRKKFGVPASAGSAQPPYVFSAGILILRSAGFQTCRMADFQVGSAALRPAGLETRGTADLEVCATLNRYQPPDLR
jgi:hypothetical protein